jgi:hypothetical protein
MIFDRVSKRYPTATLFGSGPNPYGVDQGSLSDSYFLATSAATAEYPERIRKFFITQDLNKEGIVVA